MIRRPGSPCRNCGVEVRRSHCRRHGRASLVHLREQFAIVSRGLLMLSLSRQGSLVLLALRSELLRGRSGRNATGPAVVADMVHGVVVDDDRPVIDIGNVGDVHIGHAAVVIEVASAPLATVEADSGVAETVVNAAIETDVRAPVAAMENVEAIVPAPPRRGPEHRDRSDHPCARNPVVAIVIVPGPIAWRPKIAGSGTNRLRINRKSRRAEPH